MAADDLAFVIFVNDKFFDFASSLSEAKKKVIEKRGYFGGRLHIIPNPRTRDGNHFYIRQGGDRNDR